MWKRKGAHTIRMLGVFVSVRDCIVTCTVATNSYSVALLFFKNSIWHTLFRRCIETLRIDFLNESEYWSCIKNAKSKKKMKEKLHSYLFDDIVAHTSLWAINFIDSEKGNTSLRIATLWKQFHLSWSLCALTWYASFQRRKVRFLPWRYYKCCYIFLADPYCSVRSEFMWYIA